MVYETLCDVCGRLTETKFCSVRKINVCPYCCTSCEQRSTCEIRVWFKSLVPQALSPKKAETRLGKGEKKQTTLF